MSNLSPYQLLDSGNGRKLEQFGEVVLDRPCSQAVWKPQLPNTEWQKADAKLSRDTDTRWEFRKKPPTTWQAKVNNIIFELSTTDFGHVGIFPEHSFAWGWIQEQIKKTNDPSNCNVLNLFAYSGGASLAAAQAGASVCHLDASKKMIEWAKRNATINNMENAPIRWIVDDAIKFLQKEQRRGRKYDGIILDPPSFGRGAKMELFKIDDHLSELLTLCRQVLSDKPLFLFLSCHTPGYTPTVLSNIMTQVMSKYPNGELDAGEMTLKGQPSVFQIPNGAYCGWRRK